MSPQANIFFERLQRGRRAAVAAAALVALAACFRNPVTQRREAKLISEAAEREIGAETRRRLVEEYGELDSPVLREYVASLGRKLAVVSDRPRLDFVFTVLDTELVNAFAAPGGYIFVTRGLLDELNSEAELAAVLGHEVGHVCAWHSINMIEKQMGYGTLTTLGAIVSGIQLGPEAMIMVAQTADLFTNLYLLGYSRENELEADRVGMRYAISAGYDPAAAVSFFERLRRLEQAQGPDEWETYFRSHPPTADRIQQAQLYVGRMASVRRPVAEGFEAYQEMKELLPHLDAAEVGRFDGARFVQPRWGLALELPSGWKWEPENRRVLAAFREAHGEAWGELRRQRLARGLSARDYAQKTALEKRWKLLQGREALYPSGYAYVGQYYGSGVLGGVYQIKALFLVTRDAGYILLCAAPPDKIANYLIPFEQLLRSFRVA